MHKNLIPLGVSALLFLLIQLINFGPTGASKIEMGNTDEANEIFEIKRYLNDFNPNLGKQFAEEKLKIDTSLNVVNKITIVNVMQYDEWIGKNSNLNVLNKDISLDSSILTIRKPSQTGTKLGYIQLKSIRNGAYQSFMKGMELLAGTKGIDTLYLDLRSCNTGQDQEAIKIANQLVYDADMILGKEMFFNGTVNKITSRGKVFFPLKQINLITNNSTAGVSEFLTHMLMNGTRVTKYGDSTSGHDLIMRFFPLSSGNYVYIPIGYYCNKCEKADKDYDVSRLDPIVPDIRMEESAVDEMLSGLFKVRI